MKGYKYGHAYAHMYLTCMFVQGGAFFWIAPNHGKAILNTVLADLKIFSHVNQRMLTLYWFWRLWRPKQWKLLRFGDMNITGWISFTCVAWGSPKWPRRYCQWCVWTLHGSLSTKHPAQWPAQSAQWARVPAQWPAQYAVQYIEQAAVHNFFHTT